MSDMHFLSGLPADADEKVRTEYVTHYVETYKRKKWKDNILSEYYTDDFRTISKRNFHAIPTILRRELRDLLRSFCRLWAKETKYSHR